MPLYDFKCTECDNVFEDLKSMDTKTVPCTECGKEAKRQIGGSSFALQGSGWYSTDNKKLKSVNIADKTK